MKIFSLAAVLTGLVLVSMSYRRRRYRPAGSAPADTDRRYAIDDLMNGLD